MQGQDSTGEDEVWEQVSQEIAQWSLLIGKLDDIAALSSILSFKPASSHRNSNASRSVTILEYTIPDISLMTIFNGGNGIVSELVSKWIASTGVDAASFFGAKEEEEDEEEVTENFVPNSSISYIELLRKHFPFSLRSGVLLCHLVWEYANAWSNNIDRMEYLATSIEYLNFFEKADFALKHGICCIIWNSFFRKYIQASVKIVNHIGKSMDESRSSSFTDLLVSWHHIYFNLLTKP